MKARRNPDRTVEERLNQLETDLNAIRDAQNMFKDQLSVRLDLFDNRLKQEEQERQAADKLHATFVEQALAGNMRLETTGLCWLMAGALLGAV